MPAIVSHIHYASSNEEHLYVLIANFYIDRIRIICLVCNNEFVFCRIKDIGIRILLNCRDLFYAGYILHFYRNINASNGKDH